MKTLTTILILALLSSTLVAENPNLSFSKFSEALKEGRAAAQTSLQTFEEPWEDQLQRAPARRQPSELGATSQHMEMQVIKYQVETIPTPPKTVKTKPTPRKQEKPKMQVVTKKPKPAKKTPDTTEQKNSKSLSERFQDLGKKTSSKPIPQENRPEKQNTQKKENPSTLKVQVVKDPSTTTPKKNRKVQENSPPPTKIKNFKY